MILKDTSGNLIINIHFKAATNERVREQWWLIDIEIQLTDRAQVKLKKS